MLTRETFVPDTKNVYEIKIFRNISCVRAASNNTQPRFATNGQHCTTYDVTMLLPQYVLVFAGALVRSFFPPFVRLFVLAHYDQEHYQSVQTCLGTQHASLYPLRDRLTADDCVGTAFLPISAISGQGDDGESATVEKLTGTVCTVFGCSNNELVINVRFPPSGFLPLFGPCFVNFYGSTREYSDLPDEYDDLNIGMVSRAQVVYLLRREKSTWSTQLFFLPWVSEVTRLSEFRQGGARDARDKIRNTGRTQSAF